jgi:predicted kinase
MEKLANNKSTIFSALTPQQKLKKKNKDFAQDWKFFLCLYVEKFDERALDSVGKVHQGQ